MIRMDLTALLIFIVLLACPSSSCIAAPHMASDNRVWAASIEHDGIIRNYEPSPITNTIKEHTTNARRIVMHGVELVTYTLAIFSSVVVTLMFATAIFWKMPTLFRRNRRNHLLLDIALIKELLRSPWRPLEVFKRHRIAHGPRPHEIVAIEQWGEMLQVFHTRRDGSIATLRIANGPDTWSETVYAEIAVSTKHFNYPSQQNPPNPILELWVNLPIHPDYDKSDGAKQEIPIIIRDLQCRDGILLDYYVTPTVVNAEGVESSRIRIFISQFPDQFELPSNLNISFDCLNSYISLGDRHPFNRYGLNFNMSLPQCNGPVLLRIEHHISTSLRGRRDVGVSYYSPALGINESYLQNISHFQESLVQIRYIYGNNDASSLTTIGLHALNAGISILTGAFALHLIEKGGADLLAAVTFGLSLMTSFAETVRSRRLFSPSSSFSRMSWITISAIGFGSLHITFVTYFGLVLGWQPNWRDYASNLGFSVGIICVNFAIGYIILLHWGYFLGYICDICNRPIKIRSRVRTSVDERLAKCGGCTTNSNGKQGKPVPHISTP